MTTQRGGFQPHALIVSDDPDLASFLGEGLLVSGFWTSVVASAVQTLELFRLRSFDLAIIDADLAGLGAMELLRRLLGGFGAAAATARTDIPVVVIGSVIDTADREAYEAFGATAVLAAPLNLPLVAVQLHELVRGWRAAHPDRPWADAAGLSGLVNGGKA